MAIPEKPTLTTPPAAPIRGQDPTVFANRANAYLAFITSNVSDLTAAIDWQNTVFTAVESEAVDAAQSAVDAADQAGLASTARTGAETAQALSEEWATSLVVVSDGIRGARYYANVAEAAVAELPEGTINDSIVSLDSAWSSQKIDTLKANQATTYTKTESDNLFGANWQAISTSITLVANSYYAVDFGSSALTLTLPPSPGTSDFVQLYKSAGTSKGAIIARNGETIMGVAENLNINFEATALYLVYNGTDWRIVR